MDYSILAAELQQPQYVGMSDAEIVATLNDPGASTRQRVPIERLQATAMQVSVYMALRTAIATPTTPPAILALCQTTLDLVNARFGDIDLDDPTAQSMFAALQQYGIINPTQAAAINALAVAPGTSRANALGLEDVTESDVATARNWHEYDNLEQRLTAGSAIALGWLRQQREIGAVAPEWAAVLERM